MADAKKLREIRERMKGKKFLFVPYMHADWAWCHTRQWHALRYLAIFEDVAKTMAEQPDYRWYMDCFTTEIGPVLERKPELLDVIRPLAEEGKIQIAGGFANVRPNMVGDEAYVRNMIIGRKRFAEYFPGVRNDVQSEAVDVALGHPQIPQLLRKGGFRYYRSGRPYGVLEKKGLPQEFFWEGIDGSKILLSWGLYGGLFEPERVQKLIDKLDSWDDLVEELYDTELEQYLRNTDMDILWIAQGCDDVLPLKAFNSDLDLPLAEIIRRWNAREDSSMAILGPNDFFDLLEERKDRLPTHKGTIEICDVAYNVGWAGEKGLLNRRLKSSELLCEVESWELLAELFGGKPAYDFTPLWEESLTATCHATAWLFMEDFDELLDRIDLAMGEARKVRKSALRTLAERMERKEGAIGAAFNALPYERKAVLSLTLPSGHTDGLYFTDGAGNILPHQVLRAYEYTSSVWEHEVLVQVTLPSMGWTVISAQGVDTDCRLGGVFKRAKRPDCFDTTTPFAVESDVLSLKFEHGRLREILDKESGKTLSHPENDWNSLVFAAIDTDKGDLHAGPVTGERQVKFDTAVILENGPVRWKVRLCGSDGVIDYAQEITLEKGSRDVVFSAEFDWRGEPGRLECRIPVEEGCEIRGGIPFGSEKKDVDSEPYCDDGWYDMHRQWKGLFCAKDYVRAVSDTDSRAVLSAEGDRFWLLSREKGYLSYILINSVRLIPDTWEDSVNRRGIESRGPHCIHWGVRIGKAEEPDRAAARAAQCLRNPVLVTIPYGRKGEAVLPAHASMVSADRENITVTAFYRDGEDAILRLYETDGLSCGVNVTLPREVISAVSENFIGEGDGRAVTAEGKTLSFPAGAHEIVTLRVRFA
ncbi:MAG: hypothetical protein IJC35_04045 [Oscillospiraceae bacterium]|nr:hypothetical protein [Oscillospiraceae bacterium]